MKVSDFGLSIQLHGDTVSPTSLCGTLAWIALEALLHKPCGTKVDVYRFGVSRGSSSPAASPTPEGPPTRPTTRES